MTEPRVVRRDGIPYPYIEHAQDPDAGANLADDECLCADGPTIAQNEHGDQWCSVCGERVFTWLKFPMPNDVINGSTVVASVEYRDEPSLIALVLLLNKQAPYFTVAHYYQEASPDAPVYPRGHLLVHGDFENIVPAVEEYTQQGGDY